VVVIGNGMVGQRFCDLMTEGESPIARVVTFCEEPVPAYDRVHLSEYFSGKDAQALSLASLDWYAERKVELHLGERGARVDRDRRVVVSSTGREVRYDRVVLATGSSAYVPPISGANRPGVFVYRTLADLDLISSYAKRAKSAAVIGGVCSGWRPRRRRSTWACRLTSWSSPAASCRARWTRPARGCCRTRSRRWASPCT